MMTWLSANLGTIVVSLILAGIVTAIIVNMIKERKNGCHSSCGGCSGCSGCSHCAMREAPRDTR